VRRRAFIGTCGVAAALSLAPPLRGARGAGVLRLGILSATPRKGPLWEGGFERRLKELGYSDGQNSAIEFVQAPLQDEPIRAAATKLVRDGVDIIVAGGHQYLAKGALDATKTLPIVTVALDYDPLALGYIKSLARPGGNLTGVFAEQISLTAKRLQLIKQAAPENRKIIVFWDRACASQWHAAQEAATGLDLELHGAEFRERPYDYDRALGEIPADHRGGLVVLMSPFFFEDRDRLAEFTLRHRLPSISGLREAAAAGGLLSYGSNLVALFERLADYVDRIVKGTKPADLAVEIPTKFELVINLRTAKALGIAMPQALMVAADEVIE
jgi:putative ABC transport system substrate-binding protein